MRERVSEQAKCSLFSFRVFIPSSCERRERPVLACAGCLSPPPKYSVFVSALHATPTDASYLVVRYFNNSKTRNGSLNRVHRYNGSIGRVHVLHHRGVIQIFEKKYFNKL